MKIKDEKSFLIPTKARGWAKLRCEDRHSLQLSTCCVKEHVNVSWDLVLPSVGLESEKEGGG